MHDFSPDESHAISLDAADPLAPFRARFDPPPGRLCLDGHSLGPLCHDAERRLVHVLEEWRALALEGWMRGSPPWFRLAERVGGKCAPLVGAYEDEVVCAGSTTVNLHALLAGFFSPGGVGLRKRAAKRTRIVGDATHFPSDLYALRSHLRLRGLDPVEHLVLVPPRDDGLVDEADIVARLDDDVALVVVSAVTYRTSQLFDVARIAREAGKRGIPVGVDASHAAGVVPLRLHDWGVDFAVWSGYKYLGGGPGCPAFLFVHRRRFDMRPGMAGWFGSLKEKQFDMALEIEHAAGAGGWQISTPPVLAMAPLDGALDVIREAGIERIREKSTALTDYLIRLIDARRPRGVSVASPRAAQRRGGHLAIEHADAGALGRRLAERGAAVDVRPPDTIRVAPAPLTTSFHNVWRFVRTLESSLG